MYMGRHASLSQSSRPIVCCSRVIEAGKASDWLGKDKNMAPNAAGAGDKFPSRWAQWYLDMNRRFQC